MPAWQAQITDKSGGGGLHPSFTAQYISMTMGVLKSLLTKDRRGKYTKVATEFFQHVRMVVIDEADEIWSDGGEFFYS